MPRVPRRTGSTRPSTSGGAAAGRQTRDNQPTAEEVRNYPDFIDEGDNLSLDPEDASTGFLTDENITITEAKFEKFVYRRRIGDELVEIDKFDDGRPAMPELRLSVTLRRDQHGAQLVTETYKYGRYDLFGPSKDGNFARVWPKIVAERKTPPQPRKTTAAVIFLDSLKEAGLSVEELNSQGVSALVGLTCHVSRRKVDGMHELAKPLVLVDAIEDRDTSVSTGSARESAIVDDDADATDYKQQATDFIVSLLEDNNGEIEKSEVFPALLDSKSIDEDTRGEIVSLIRDKKFMQDKKAPWTFDGTTITAK